LKYFILVFLFCLSGFAQNKKSEDASYTDGGLVTCFQNKNKTYFFEWDHIVKTTEKKVTYFELSDYVKETAHLIKSCADRKYIKKIPTSILKDIEELQSILPSEIIFSLKQASEGAHVFRIEETAAEYVKNHEKLFKADQAEVLTDLRYATGDRFALKVMNYFIKQLTAKTKSCDSLIGTCDYYLCQEMKNPCALDGYNLSYGYKYCSDSKFKLLNQMHTELGKSWVTDVFQCLQMKNFTNTLALSKDTNFCSNVSKQSFDSHPDCYVSAGFCKLKGSEKIRIFNIIKKEILSARTITQGFEVIKKCAKDE
jgi:hypothetical protein